MCKSKTHVDLLQMNKKLRNLDFYSGNTRI